MHLFTVLSPKSRINAVSFAAADLKYCKFCLWLERLRALTCMCGVHAALNAALNGN